MPLTLDVTADKNAIRISGDLGGLLNDRRTLMTLTRLEYKKLDGDNVVAVPTSSDTVVKIAEELRRILQRNGYVVQLGVTIQHDLEAYTQEIKTFDEFSTLAQQIRNDKFYENQRLVADFDSFQRTVSSSLVRTLYPLQLLSAFHLAFSQHACNFSVPGAGKTSIVYAAYAHLHSLDENDPKRVDKLMVIAPLSAFAPWEEEYAECFGRKIDSQRISGIIPVSTRYEHLYSGNPAELTLIPHSSVNSLTSAIRDFLKRNKVMLIVDEAHRIKNVAGTWAQSILSVAENAKSRVILTGTPAPNGYQDLYNLFKFIYPRKFEHILQMNYADLVEMTNNATPDDSRVTKLTNSISSFFLRIKKQDLNLPPTTEEKVQVTLSERQRRIYDFIESKVMKGIHDDLSKHQHGLLNKARLIRLRQAATNPALLASTLHSTIDSDDVDYEVANIGTESLDAELRKSDLWTDIEYFLQGNVPSKFESTLELVKQIIANDTEKVLVWTTFVLSATGLSEYLTQNGIPNKIILGMTPQEDREDIIEDFNDPQKMETRVLITNPFSVAESISLHKGCHNAIYLERDYNCSNFVQSKDRIHRVGLPEGQLTRYFYLMAAETIDSIIDERLDMKLARMEAMINQDIPLFQRIDSDDEQDLINALMQQYAKRINTSS